VPRRAAILTISTSKAAGTGEDHSGHGTGSSSGKGESGSHH